jgi:tRNA (mo5U34)-methyltransferase
MASHRPVHIREIAKAAARYSKYLDTVKAKHPLSSGGWYPYPTLAAFPVLAEMLQGERQDLLAVAGTSAVLDIGCGDGALSFFLESLGCAVKAIDHPSSNYNRTLGFQTLKAVLNSSVDLEIRDLDSDLGLASTYGLTFCLGVLYHLKNPVGFLEALARHTRYCVLSTRIAQRTALGTPMEADSLAVLLGAEETNGDSTNYWIFSETGLRRLFDRTGWVLCDYLATGYKKGSDPVRADRDQRAFCLLRSKQPDPWLELDLAGGWHAMENGSWRWTERTFTVRLSRKPSDAPTLRFRFILPQRLLEAVGPIRLHAVVGDCRLPSCEYTVPGEQIYAQTINFDVQPHDGDVVIRFELDKALSPSAADSRELGVQVVFWSYDGPSPSPLYPIRLE